MLTIIAFIVLIVVSILRKPLPGLFRKRIVAVKRKPCMIPLNMMGLAFVYYSLNLSSIARTTTYINGKNMGLAEFAAMLFGVLLLVCLLNAFPRRKRVNITMLILMILLTQFVMFADLYYRERIILALTREENRILLTDYIDAAWTAMNVHTILLGVGLLLTALLPVYSILLKKINTNILIEDNGAMGKIDLSGEDA